MRTIFDPRDDGTDAYDLLTSIVVPRPIAWISTVDAQGVGNLAPHSFFTVASHTPPTVTFSSVGLKDTLRNVLATQHFVVNVVPEGMQEAANGTSASFESDVDEAEALGLRLEPSSVVPVPRVADSPASIECRLHSTIKIGNSHLVIGEVLAITADEDALDDGRPTMAALRPISRLGRDEWGHPPRVFRLQRPG